MRSALRSTPSWGSRTCSTPPSFSARQEKYVRILRSSSENLLHLVNEILDFSKIESGKVSLEERTFDLRQLVHQAAHGLHMKAEEKGLALETRVDERLPDALLGDPVKIGQVLTNLLGNALKFTAQGSVVVEIRVLELETDAVSFESGSPTPASVSLRNVWRTSSRTSRRRATTSA